MTSEFNIVPGAASLLVKLKRLLEEQSVDCWLVGGYVRDTLLGRSSRDIDLAVTARALEVASKVASDLGGAYVPLDELNEIARVVLPGEERWHLDFSSVQAGIEADLARRDFTINALAVNIGMLAQERASIPIIDPFGGQKDLEEGLVRAVGENIFREDPARLLRAVRLAAEYGFTIEEKTEALIRSQSQLIAEIAGERIREELCRLLAVPEATPFLYQLDRLGLLEAIIPEMADLKGVEQPKEHFWDVFHHSLETVASTERLLRIDSGDRDEVLSLVPWSPAISSYFEEEIGGLSRKTLLKLAALLHDIAKPKTRTVGETCRVRFLGHTKEGAAMAGHILERLRFSNRQIKMVQKMIDYHLRPGQMSNEGLPTRRAIYRYFRDTADVSIDILFLGLADHLATRGPNLDLALWKEHTQLVDYILAERQKEQSVVAPPKLIDGHDLIDIFGIKPGPQIGELLEAVREAQAAGEITTREEALAFVHQRLDSEVKNAPKR